MSTEKAPLPDEVEAAFAQLWRPGVENAERILRAHIAALEARLRVFDALAAEQVQYDENGLWVALVKKSVALQEQNTALEAKRRIFDEWLRGCSCAPVGQPWGCRECTESMAKALAQTGEDK